MGRQQLVALSLALGLGLALTLTGLAGAPGVAEAAPPEDTIAHLSQITLANPTPDIASFTQGACVSYLEAGNNTAILASVCRVPEGLAVAERISGRENLTHGQCIGVLRGVAPPQ